MIKNNQKNNIIVFSFSFYSDLIVEKLVKKIKKIFKLNYSKNI